MAGRHSERPERVRAGAGQCQPARGRGAWGFPRLRGGFWLSSRRCLPRARSPRKARAVLGDRHASQRWCSAPSGRWPCSVGAWRRGAPRTPGHVGAVPWHGCGGPWRVWAEVQQAPGVTPENVCAQSSSHRVHIPRSLLSGLQVGVQWRDPMGDEVWAGLSGANTWVVTLAAPAAAHGDAPRVQETAEPLPRCRVCVGQTCAPAPYPASRRPRGRGGGPSARLPLPRFKVKLLRGQREGPAVKRVVPVHGVLARHQEWCWSVECGSLHRHWRHHQAALRSCLVPAWAPGSCRRLWAGGVPSVLWL